MSAEKIDTLVIGGGQAGLAMSEHLGKAGIPHLVVERHRIAERWRSERWDSLVANGPAWHDRFPTMEFPDIHPDTFPGKEVVADYFVAHAKMIGAPIRCGVEVTKVEPLVGQPGFRAETSAGTILAQRVVVATGAFQRPVIPGIVPETAGVMQVHSSAYRNPGQLPEGAVLVVGAGSSGAQIADELLRAGRRVYLSVGPHERPPRTYRGRDFGWWLGVLGKWDAATPPAGAEHVTIAVSGARGGETVDFRRFARNGMILVGSTLACAEGRITFAGDLRDNIERGNATYLDMLDQADAYVVRNGLPFPQDPEARRMEPVSDNETRPLRDLDLAGAGVGTIIWATGFDADYSWLKGPALDERGRPIHQRGVSTEPGIYFLGLPWQSRRGSSFIWGVWHDAAHIAAHIVTQHKYLSYPDPEQNRPPSP